jgi:hypothetical protein
VEAEGVIIWMNEQILRQILSEVKDIRTDQLEMKVEIKEIKADQLEMKVDIQQIKQAVMETNEVVRRIVSNQEQQQRISELLSFRSIEHEAMLKRR